MKVLAIIVLLCCSVYCKQLGSHSIHGKGLVKGEDEKDGSKAKQAEEKFKQEDKILKQAVKDLKDKANSGKVTDEDIGTVNKQSDEVGKAADNLLKENHDKRVINLLSVDLGNYEEIAEDLKHNPNTQKAGDHMSEDIERFKKENPEINENNDKKGHDKKSDGAKELKAKFEALLDQLKNLVDKLLSGKANEEDRKQFISVEDDMLHVGKELYKKHKESKKFLENNLKDIGEIAGKLDEKGFKDEANHTRGNMEIFEKEFPEFNSNSIQKFEPRKL